MNRFKTNKSLGQHFLTDHAVISQIIESIDSIDKKNIIEIGPGTGNLTKQLLYYAKSVTAIEKDKRLIPTLNQIKLENPNTFNFHMADAINYNFNEIIKDSHNSIIVSNLPYNVGTAIFLNLLKYIDLYQYAILMFQTEVANRITASVGNKCYGRLSVISNIVASTQKLFDVPATAFTPAPKVSSSVIQVAYTPHQYNAEFMKKLQTVTQLCFSMRRKVIKNTLKKYNIDYEGLNINPNARAEELTLQDYIVITNHIKL